MNMPRRHHYERVELLRLSIPNRIGLDDMGRENMS
jgi:hypothetical protein